jgi:superkiller protein 3
MAEVPMQEHSLVLLLLPQAKQSILFESSTIDGSATMSATPGRIANFGTRWNAQTGSFYWALYLICLGGLFLQTPVKTHGQGSLSSQSATSPMQQHYEAAFRSQSEGDLLQANSEYKLFLSMALHRMANGQAHLGDYVRAARFYDESLRLAANDRDVQMDYAGAALDASDWRKAKTLASQVLEELKSHAQPPDQRAVSVLAEALLELGEHQAALDQFKAAALLHPGFDTSSQLAAAYLVLGDRADAAAILDEAPQTYGDTAELHMKIGILYGKTKFFDAATEEFEKAIAKDNRIQGAHYALGATYMMQSGEPANDKAEAEFRQELAIDPDNLLVYMPLGHIAMDQHRYQEAEADLKRAVAANQSDAGAYLVLGKLYKETGRFAEAKIAFRKSIVLTLDPSKNGYAVEQAYYWLGRLLMQGGSPVEGRKYLDVSRNLLYLKEQGVESRLAGNATLQAPLERTNAANPEDLSVQKAFEKQVGPLIASSFDNLGVNAANAGDYQDASSYFEQAAQWNPNLNGVDANWGRAAFFARDYSKAVGPLSRTIALHPADQHLRAMLGFSLCLVHEYAKAVPVFQLIESKLEANPELNIAYTGSMAMAGDSVGGLARLKSLEEANPGIPLVHSLLGEVYAANKNYAQAAEELRVSLRLDPSNAETKNKLALTDLALGDNAEAMQLFWELAESGSKDGEVYYRLARLQIDLGSPKVAIETLETAIELNPMNAAYHQELAEAYRKNAQPDEAERESRQSETLQALNEVSHQLGTGN